MSELPLTDLAAQSPINESAMLSKIFSCRHIWTFKKGTGQLN